jgi:cysteine desulfurase
MDHAATTPCDPRVVEAMLPYFTEQFGNPGSRNHAFGWEAEEAVDTARRQVADLLGADRKEIIFTSGSTESNNIAIKGAAYLYAKADAGQTGRGHIISSIIEHKAVLDPCKRLAKEGFEVTFLEPGPDGIITREMVEGAMREDTILVSLMWANNEIGTINEVPEIGALCHEREVVFHTDATQWAGKMPVDVVADNIDLLSMSGHKIYGPKGVGVLYVRRRKPRVRLQALVDGGGQERGFRPGTLNVTGIVGLGKACEIAGQEMDADRERLLALRRRFERRVTEALDVVQIKDIAMSSGSACTSASLEPSYVLKGLGVGDELAHSSLRLSLGRWTTDEEVEFAAAKVIEGVTKLRLLSPLYDMYKEGIDITKIEWAAH